MFCHEFHLVDLRVYENCKKVVVGCDHVFNLAADMGGMGFIQSNHSVIMYNNTMISFNMLELSRVADIKRYVVADDAVTPFILILVSRPCPSWKAPEPSWTCILQVLLRL